MANNSRSEATDPGSTSVLQRQSEPTTTTTITTTPGFSDFIPTVIPALQSSSYILVLFVSFVAWSSRKLVVDFLTKHIDLVESLKENLDTQLDTANKQMEVLNKLANNNEKLVETVGIFADKTGQPVVKIQAEKLGDSVEV